jgi:hypothetical protein
MKLSDFKGEKAFEVAASLITPMARIARSDIFQKTKVTSKLELAQLILKADPRAAREILAILADVPAELYVCTGTTVMEDILTAVSDDDFASLFISPGQKMGEERSFSVSENAGMKV